jgi:hypothetical protein
MGSLGRVLPVGPTLRWSSCGSGASKAGSDGSSMNLRNRSMMPVVLLTSNDVLVMNSWQEPGGTRWKQHI